MQRAGRRKRFCRFSFRGTSSKPQVKAAERKQNSVRQGGNAHPAVLFRQALFTLIVRAARSQTLRRKRQLAI